MLLRPRARLAARLPQGMGGPNIPPPSAPRRPDAKPEEPAGIGAVQAVASRERARPEFEGDKAIKTLRQRLSLDPEFLPAPPVPPRASALLPSLGNIALVVLVAAAVAGGVVLMSIDTRPAAIKRIHSAAVAPPPPAVTSASLRPAPRLIVEGRQTFANEALALGISLNDATGSEFALLTGLVSGTRLSVGGPFGTNGWRLPARELGSALAYAPKDFVGVMNAAIDLRMPNDMLVDSKIMRLEWVPKQLEPQLARGDREEQPRTVAMRPIDPAELELLVKRGQEYLNIGDIVSARLLLRRAAAMGDAQAALMLGASFDPSVLVELGVLGFAPDVTQARAWYQQAQERGSAEASRRLARLAR